MNDQAIQWERVEAGAVKVGDRIAKSRNARPELVEQVDVLNIAVRLHIARELCPECDGHGGSETQHCPTCYRRARNIHAGDSPAHVGGGNIRPRKSLRLWRVV